jgi:hypothetical protein
MKKIYISLFILLISISGYADENPQTDFYHKQLDSLKFFKSESQIKALVHRQVTKSTKINMPFTGNKNASIKIPAKITHPEQLVQIVIQCNFEAESRRNRYRAARYNLTQTQALEPIIKQFSAFMSESPLMVSLNKEHPQPGVSALKFRIANFIGEEAKQQLNLFLLELAQNSRNKAYELIKTSEKLALTRQTIALYNDLKKSSESLYSDGKASFDELTMVSVEIESLKTLRNKYMIEKNEILESIYALLADKRPEINFCSKKSSLESHFKIESASIEKHPLLLSEKTRLQKIQATIKLIRRAAFPDFTAISALSPGGNSTVPDVKKHGFIDFNRSFSKQLSSSALAQKARIKQTRANLQARLNSDLTALKITKQSHKIIVARMQPDLKSAFASVKSSYENGQTGFSKLVESERRLLEMQNRLIDSEYEILKLNASILFDLGKINF